MPGRLDIFAQHGIPKLSEEEYRLIIEQLANENLGVTKGPVPPIPADAPPTHEMRNVRAHDEAAMSPQEWGPVPLPANAEDAEDEQEEIDRTAGYDLRDREEAEADALARRPEAPTVDVTLASRSGTPPPEAAEEKLPWNPIVDTFLDRVGPTPKRAPVPAPEANPEMSFSRGRQMDAARAAYDAATLSRTNPYSEEYVDRENPFVRDPTGRWEDEFLANRSALTDDQIRRRAAVIGIFGNPGDAQAYTAREMKMRQGYDEGLEAARMKDYGEQRISREEAEALAATGNISPEGAARLTNKSMLRQAYPNGMYAQGLNAERADRLYQQFVLGQQGQAQRQAQELNSKADIARENNVAGIIRSVVGGRKAAGADQPLSYDQRELIASNLFDSFQLPMSVAREAVDGDFRNVPGEIADPVEAAIVQSKVAVRDRTGERGLALGPRKKEAEGNIATRQAGDRAAIAGQEKAWQRREEVRLMMSAVKNARTAWDALSPDAKRAFVQVGPEAWEGVRELLGADRFQAEMTHLQKLSSQLLRMNAGLSQTKSEMAGQLRTQGITSGFWNPLKDPAGYEEFLRTVENETRLRYKSMLEDGRWELGKQYESRMGAGAR